MDVHVERGWNNAYENGVGVWAFERSAWGRCGQGRDEESALAHFRREAGAPVRIVERIDGDEQAFRRDFEPAAAWMIDDTRRILREARRETLARVGMAADGALDARVPGFRSPSWAKWRTARDLAWHVADCESRYYLPSLGLPAKPRAEDLIIELTESAEWVEESLLSLRGDLVHRREGEVWTSTKLLRRLAWHERGELHSLRWLLRSAP